MLSRERNYTAQSPSSRDPRSCPICEPRLGPDFLYSGWQISTESASLKVPGHTACDRFELRHKKTALMALFRYAVALECIVTNSLPQRLKGGVRPFGRTGSGGGFDRGAGVAFLEFDGAEIPQG